MFIILLGIVIAVLIVLLLDIRTFRYDTVAQRSGSVHIPESAQGSHIPIDLVITWVNTNDVEWNRRYLKAIADTSDGVQHQPSVQKISDYDIELYYSVRLALKNMPWLRKIIIFSQRPQKPSWINEFEKVMVIHHDECGMKETFNGMVTTAYTSHIRDMSEHYIQMDDDVFTTQYVPPSYFFTEGKPIMRYTTQSFLQTGKIRGTNYQKIMDNTKALLQKRVGRFHILIHTNNHTPCPSTKTLTQTAKQSIARDYWDKLGAVRSEHDFDFFSLYMLEYIVRRHRDQVYVGKADTAFVEGYKFPANFKHKTRFLCINNQFTEPARKYLSTLL
jgi:hypothetical protein